MKVAIILIFYIALLGTFLAYGEDGFKDCTEHFKNRLASFEYSYYQGYWLYPYSYHHWDTKNYAIGKMSAKVSSTRTLRDIQWHLHDCGEGAVCAETKREKYEKYYMDQNENDWLDVAKDTNLGEGSNKNKHMAIWCQSCEPNPGTNTYNKCQLRFHPEIEAGNKYTVRGYSSKYKLTWKYRFSGAKSNSAPDDWFHFRIVSPPTREYWNVIFDKCNKNVDNMEITKTVKSSIETTHRETSTKEQKFNMGLEASYYLTAALGFEAKKTYSETNMRKISEEHKKKFNTVVPPGKRLFIKQKVAEAAFVKIATDQFETEQIDC